MSDERDFNQMLERWIEWKALTGLPGNPEPDAIITQAFEAAYAGLSGSLQSLTEAYEVVDAWRHPLPYKGGHEAANILSPGDNRNAEEYVQELVEARTELVDLDAALSSVDVGGGAFYEDFPNARFTAIEPAQQLEDGYSEFGYGEMGYGHHGYGGVITLERTFTVTVSDDVDLTVPLRLRAKVRWQDLLGLDNLRTAGEAVLIVEGVEYPLEFPEDHPAGVNHSISHELPVGVLQPGIHEITFRVKTKLPAVKSKVLGNRNNETVLTNTRWVRHDLTMPTDVRAFRMIVYSAGKATSKVSVGEFQAIVAGEAQPLVGAATSTTPEYPVYRAFDGDASAGEPGWLSLDAPSFEAPQVLMAKFSDEQVKTLEAIRWVHTDKLAYRQPKDYEIQFTVDPGATLLDPLDDAKWFVVGLGNGNQDGTERALSSEFSLESADVTDYFKDVITVSDVTLSGRQVFEPIVLDSRQAGSVWVRVSWEAYAPEGYGTRVMARVGDTLPLMALPQELSTGERVEGAGRYLELIPQVDMVPGGDYPVFESLTASFIKDPEGEIRGDVYSLKTNLIRMNWELERFKASMVTGLEQVVSDVYKDTDGVDLSLSSNWKLVGFPLEAGIPGIAPEDEESPCVVTSLSVSIPLDISGGLFLADYEGIVKFEVSLDDGVTWSETGSGIQAPAGANTGQFRLRATLLGSAVLRAWAYYY